MRVLFIVEAGAAYGMGHLMRCRVLMREMKRRGVDVDLCLRGDAVVPEACAWPARIDAQSYDWIVIDGYGFFAEGLCENLKRSGARLLVIDDLPRPHAADVILNPNMESPGDNANGAGVNGRRLFGPRYAPVAEDYGQTRWDNLNHKSLERILISCGGVDRMGRTEQILADIEDWDARLDLDVVVGPWHPFEKDLRAYRGRHRLEIHKAPDGLASLMERADLMISAAGSTVWEACAVGVPLVAIRIVENQTEPWRTLQRFKAALCMDASDLSSGESSSRLTGLLREASRESVRSELSARGRSLVDGRGAERTVDEMLAVSESAAYGAGPRR